jgi:hypothetical protein
MGAPKIRRAQLAFGVFLEDELSAEPPLTLAAAAAQGGGRGGQLAGDLAEGTAVDIGGRVAEVRRVGQTEYIGFKLEGQLLSDLEVPEERAIQVEVAGSAHDVTPGVTEGSCTGWEGPEDGPDASPARRRAYRVADKRAQPERRPNDRSGRYVDGVIYDANASGAIAITGEPRVSIFP